MRGIVRPSIAGQRFSLKRWPPEPPLNRFVDRFWKTEWALEEPFTQKIVTFPAVNLVFQADGSATVTGIKRDNDERTLEGRGWAFGVMFRAGGFQPFTELPMPDLVDRRVPASDVFEMDCSALTEQVLTAADDYQRREHITNYLSSSISEERTVGEDMSDLVEAAAAAEPPVTTVKELSERAAVSVRTLQRQFLASVGVGPKFVLDRYRLQAAGEAARTTPRSWGEVAERLGYSDQSHLTTDVSKGFGQPPATYAGLESSDSERT